MHVIFIHSFGGNAEETFFPWVRKELEKLGYRTSAPVLPDPESPSCDEWVKAVLNAYDPKEKIILIGRSLGGTVIPYLAEQDSFAAEAAFFIGAPSLTTVQDFSKKPGWQGLKAFVQASPFDAKKAASAFQQLFYWSSDDDPYVPLSDADLYQSLLGGSKKIFHKYGHFWNTEFPELIEAIKRLDPKQ